MQRLEVSGAVRPIYGSLGVKRLTFFSHSYCESWYYQSFIYSPTDAPVSCLKNIKIYVKIYIKTAPTCFGVTVAPSSGRALLKLQLLKQSIKIHRCVVNTVVVWLYILGPYWCLYIVLFSSDMFRCYSYTIIRERINLCLLNLLLLK